MTVPPFQVPDRFGAHVDSRFTKRRIRHSVVHPQDVLRIGPYRIVFKPSFLAKARQTGWDEAIVVLKTVCSQAAPRPGSDLSPLWSGPPERPGAWRARS